MNEHATKGATKIAAIIAATALAGALSACAAESGSAASSASSASGASGASSSQVLAVSDVAASSSAASASAAGSDSAFFGSASSASASAGSSSAASNAAAASAARAKLNITEDYRDSFLHGDKGPKYQKYIVLHDTEGDGSASGVVDYWDGNGAGVAAHFIINKDGSIVQCVPLDKITHHAGYGDAGHNDLFGVVEDGRDDMVGTVPIGDWAPDYGMNAWSIGIEMMHVGGSGDYPEEQLQALDDLIAYIDAYYGFESEITDHKAWRSGNSDTSPEFAGYLANYQDHRTHL